MPSRRPGYIREVGTHIVIAASTVPRLVVDRDGGGVQPRRRLLVVLGEAVRAHAGEDLLSSLTVRRRRPVGVTSARPPYSAATASGERPARSTRPLADANAGARRPTQVCRRTGCVVSSIAMKTDSSPSMTARQTVSSWRVMRSATAWRKPVTIGRLAARLPSPIARTPGS